MSARILGDEKIEASPILWRPSGAPAAPPTVKTAESAPAQPQRQQETSPPPDRDWEREAEQRAQAAHQQGYAQGLNAGTQQATERMQPVLQSLSGIINELSQLKPKYRHEAEASAVSLALAVARRVIHREIATDPEAILGLVKAAFEKVNARETHRLRVSPEDLATLQQNGPRLGLPQAVELSADPKLARGSAIFETSRGDLDASADTQLLEIERGFTDIIRRRAG
jgi:flagellar assembly protein FliH